MTQDFNGIQLNVIPVSGHQQWCLTVEEVAAGYGVKRNTVMTHLEDHKDELRLGIERGVGITDTLGGAQEKTVLYRDGVIKLGFFIRSKQAAAFRQWATDLVTQHLDEKGVSASEFFTAMKEMEARLSQRLDHVNDEVDELRETLRIFISDDEQVIIRKLIKRVKVEKSLDGRAIVGHVRKTLNVSSVYGTPDTRKVINVLKNILGEGLKIVETTSPTEAQQ